MRGKRYKKCRKVKNILRDYGKVKLLLFKVYLSEVNYRRRENSGKLFSSLAIKCKINCCYITKNRNKNIYNQVSFCEKKKYKSNPINTI